MAIPKKVTVLVAVYRARQFIDHKIQTLRNQTAFKDCHFVLLNCQNIQQEHRSCKRFADSFPDNVTLINYTDHKRLYTTWNDGIRATSSPYVMNSNVDDMLHIECIATLIDALDKNPEYGVAHCDHYVTQKPNQHWPAWDEYHGEIVTQYPLGTAGPCPMWRRSLHEQFGLFPEYRVIGDARMWEKWDAGGVKFLRVPKTMVMYYQGGNLEIRLDETTGRSLRDLDIEDTTLGS